MAEKIKTKKIKVRFSVEYDTEIEVPVNADQLEIEDAFADIDPPEMAGGTYVSDSFTIIKSEK